MSVLDKARFYREIIERAMDYIDANTVIQVPELCRKWAEGENYEQGDRVNYNGLVYECIQAHTAIASWSPDVTPALWAIVNEINAGTIDDPIAAVSGMLYIKGLIYKYEDILYRCIRDDTGSGTILHYTPDQLVGIYFEVVS